MCYLGTRVRHVLAWYYSRKLIFFVWLVFTVFCEGRFNSKYDISNYLKLYLFNQIQLCILNLGSRYLIITLTINQDKLFTFINHFKTTYRLKSEVEIVSKEGGICLDKTSWQGPQKKSKKARNLCQTTALMHFNVHNSSPIIEDQIQRVQILYYTSKKFTVILTFCEIHFWNFKFILIICIFNSIIVSISRRF